MDRDAPALVDAAPRLAQVGEADYANHPSRLFRSYGGEHAPSVLPKGRGKRAYRA
jgi:hypothetical protein